MTDNANGNDVRDTASASGTRVLTRWWRRLRDAVRATASNEVSPGVFAANGKHPPRRPPRPRAADRPPNRDNPYGWDTSTPRVSDPPEGDGPPVDLPPDPPLSPPGVQLTYLEELAEKELRRLTAENKLLLDAIARHRAFTQGANNWTADAVNRGLWSLLDEEKRARLLAHGKHERVPVGEKRTQDDPMCEGFSPQDEASTG